MQSQAGVIIPSRTARYALRFAIVFTGLFLLSFSFPHALLPDAGRVLRWPFDVLTGWVAQHLFHRPGTDRHLSDAAGMYVHIGLLIVIAALTALIWPARITAYAKLQYALTTVLRYYLAAQLFTYGFSKVFKAQFYLPEPNTLFTPAGYLGRDILYWSAMGSSRTYVVFMGVAEVIAALLLCFRRTYVAGALFAAGILLNVLAVNIGFDISVKVYTSVLLIFCAMLLIPQWLRLAVLFSADRAITVPLQWRPALLSATQRQLWRGFQCGVIILLLTDALWLYVRGLNFNDDAAPRPPLHGAYDAVLFIRNRDTLQPLLTDTFRWRRFFVHRQGYFIIQGMRDKMQSYTLDTDTAARTLWIAMPADTLEHGLDYALQPDGLLRISGWLGKDSVTVAGRKADLNTLPLMSRDVHWTEEEEEGQ